MPDRHSYSIGQTISLMKKLKKLIENISNRVFRPKVKGLCLRSAEQVQTILGVVRRSQIVSFLFSVEWHHQISSMWSLFQV